MIGVLTDEWKVTARRVRVTMYLRPFDRGENIVLSSFLVTVEPGQGEPLANFLRMIPLGSGVTIELSDETAVLAQTDEPHGAVDVPLKVDAEPGPVL